MITLYGFGRIFPEGVGETKDLRVQWALEELGLPYRVHALDQTVGELEGEAYSRISPFRQVPAIDDDGFVVVESAAVVLYLAEKAGKLIPNDVQGRTRVVQWCFAAVGTVEPTLQCLDLIDIFDREKAAHTVKAETRKLAGRWLTGVERRLEDREWIACADFTVADIMIGRRPTRNPQDRPDGVFSQDEGLLPTLCSSPRLAAHPRPFGGTTRRERRPNSLAGRPQVDRLRRKRVRCRPRSTRARRSARVLRPKLHEGD